MSERILGKHTAELDEQGTLTLYGPEGRMTLPYDEAYHLLAWLYSQQSTLNKLIQEDMDQQGEQHLTIRLYQDDLSHLDELKAAIPSLEERKPAVKVLDARWDRVSERALQLLKELQLEYSVHPMLLDDEIFAQG
jgi:hypothetical protein